MFRPCEFSATDTPDLSDVTSLSYLFVGAANFNGNINNWDVSHVTEVASMFGNAKSFNQPLDRWNVSNITGMGWMFLRASSFNQSLDTWNVSNTGDMSNMLDSTHMSTLNYDKTLNAWNKLSNTVPRNLGVRGLIYSDAGSRQSLISKGWNINGDSLVYGKIKLIKTDNSDEGGTLPGAQFEIFDNAHHLRGTVTTDANGEAITLDLPLGVYTLVERQAPAGYELDATPISANITTHGQLVQVTKGNVISVGQIKLTQVDSKDATKKLSGAEYGIFDTANHSRGRLTPEAIESITK